MSEKVIGSNGKTYTRDHPHEIISPHVMTFQEIRFWMKELSTNAAYGWANKGVAGLARALGMGEGATLQSKLTVRWIWPKEQVRLTARIREILAGHLVPRKFGKRTEGVYVNPPQPPAVTPPRMIRLTATPGKLELRAQDNRPPPKMPAFHRAFAEAIRWDPDAKKGRKAPP